MELFLSNEVDIQLKKISIYVDAIENDEVLRLHNQ